MKNSEYATILHCDIEHFIFIYYLWDLFMGFYSTNGKANANQYQFLYSNFIATL